MTYLDNSSHRGAAVLVLIHLLQGKPHVVLTKRTMSVAVHKGEVSFPGGSREEKDATLLDTALRETTEELGIDLAGVQVMGKLTDTPTKGSNFVISPYVAYLPCLPELHPEPFEVAAIVDIPLSHLMRQDSYEEVPVSLHGKPAVIRRYRYGGHTVWGATSRILEELVRRVEAGDFGFLKDPVREAWW